VNLRNEYTKNGQKQEQHPPAHEAKLIEELSNIWKIQDIANLIAPFDTEDRAKLFNKILNNKIILNRLIWNSEHITQLKTIFPQKNHKKIYESILNNHPIFSRFIYNANDIRKLKAVVPVQYHEKIYSKLLLNISNSQTQLIDLIDLDFGKIIPAFPEFRIKLGLQIATNLTIHPLSIDDMKILSTWFYDVPVISQLYLTIRLEKEWKAVQQDLNSLIIEKKKIQETKDEKQTFDFITPEASLPPTFEKKNQSKYVDFWKTQIPLLAREFKNCARKENASKQIGIAKKLYSLVATKRSEIANQLDQNSIFNPLQYGHFKTASDDRFRDAVFEEDVHFGWQFKSLRTLLKQQIDNPPNDTLNYHIRFFDDLIMRGNRTRIELSNVLYLPKINSSHMKHYNLPNSVKNKPGFILLHAEYEHIAYIFNELDPIIWELINYQFNNDPSLNETRFWFLLAQTIWFLGNCTPLQAGSSATTENFMRTVLYMHGFSLEPFGINPTIHLNWNIAVKVIPREEFVKTFLDYFKYVPVKSNAPTVIMEVDETNQSPKQSTRTQSIGLFSFSAAKLAMNETTTEDNQNSPQKDMNKCRVSQ